jgi:autotransporter translocation and assembly factor TamB
MKMNKVLLSLLLVTAFAACEDDSEKPQAISSEEAAAIMSASLASNSSGVSSVAKQSSEVTADAVDQNSGGRTQACGFSQNVSLSGSSPLGAAIQFSYDFSYKFLLSCSEETPESMSVDLSYSGDFDGPKLSSEYSGTSEVDVTGLSQEEASFMINGFYKRSGSFSTKGDEIKSGSGSVNITIDEIAVDKDTHKIVSGTATLVIEGTISGKGTYKYNGTVTFNADMDAELNIKGKKFSVNLETGATEEK